MTQEPEKRIIMVSLRLSKIHYAIHKMTKKATNMQEAMWDKRKKTPSHTAQYMKANATEVH